MIKEVEVIISGFWSDLLVANMPQDIDLLFAFSGKVVSGSRCIISRLIYVGPRKFKEKDILHYDDKEKLGLSVAPEEQIIYATGNIAPSIEDDGMDICNVVVNAIGSAFIQDFKPNCKGAEEDCEINVHLIGKVPRIFQGRDYIAYGCKK